MIVFCPHVYYPDFVFLCCQGPFAKLSLEGRTSKQVCSRMTLTLCIRRPFIAMETMKLLENMSPLLIHEPISTCSGSWRDFLLFPSFSDPSSQDEDGCLHIYVLCKMQDSRISSFVNVHPQPQEISRSRRT